MLFFFNANWGLTIISDDFDFDSSIWIPIWIRSWVLFNGVLIPIYEISKQLHCFVGKSVSVDELINKITSLYRNKSSVEFDFLHPVST